MSTRVRALRAHPDFGQPTGTLSRRLRRALASPRARRSLLISRSYLDRPFRQLLSAPDSRLEYRQANLASTAKHAELFSPPKLWRGAETGWQAFDAVFDLTGEMGYTKPELVRRNPFYRRQLTLAGPDHPDVPARSITSSVRSWASRAAKTSSLCPTLLPLLPDAFAQLWHWWICRGGSVASRRRARAVVARDAARPEHDSSPQLRGREVCVVLWPRDVAGRHCDPTGDRTRIQAFVGPRWRRHS